MKKILIKKPEVVEDSGRKKKKTDVEFHMVDATADYHTKHGKISKEDLAKDAGVEISHPAGKFVTLEPTFLDKYKRLKRNAQIITLKDIGPIITNLGINRHSKVLEAGAGSGALACYLASIAEEVISYDIDARSLATARANAESFGFKNLTIKEGSIYMPNDIEETGFDVLVLDVPEPWRAVDTAKKCLKMGGFIAVYVPHVMQMQEFVKSLPDTFLVEKAIEIIEREWAVDENRTRPATKDHAHTAFLVFVRKIG
jgi:tRNA (adenine57-N1/adenine58-N1)-methyltransferase catalytic subunit